MWTLIFLAFAQADDILADEAKGKKAAATKIAEPAAVPPAGITKPGEPATAKSPDGKIPEPPKAGEKTAPAPLAAEEKSADVSVKEGEGGAPAESFWTRLSKAGAMGYMIQGGIFMWPILILGVLALVGILIRNSVILIVQIEEHRSEGMGPWEAVLESTMHRTRPIILTAAAASLALIPIAREGFWAPMAFAMMGGIIIGTLLTLLFLPALYIAWFRVKPPV